MVPVPADAVAVHVMFAGAFAEEPFVGLTNVTVGSTATGGVGVVGGGVVGVGVVGVGVVGAGVVVVGADSTVTFAVDDDATTPLLVVTTALIT